MSLPVAIWQGTFQLFGVTLHCSVLDNGMRVIDAADVETILQAMADPNVTVDPGEMEQFARWQHGAPTERGED